MVVASNSSALIQFYCYFRNQLLNNLPHLCQGPFSSTVHGISCMDHWYSLLLKMWMCPPTYLSAYLSICACLSICLPVDNNFPVLCFSLIRSCFLPYLLVIICEYVCMFEFLQEHEFLSFVSVVCCQVEDWVLDWSLIQRSPTKCGVPNWVWLWSLNNEEVLAH